MDMVSIPFAFRTFWPSPGSRRRIRLRGEPSLNAELITWRTKQWMSRRPRAHVLHVFERACNLIGENGEVISLVTHEIGPGPFAVVLPDFRFVKAITPDSTVSVTGTAINAGQLNVRISAARLWHPRPNWHRLCRRFSNLRPYLPVIQRTLTSRSATESALDAAVQDRLAAAERVLLKGLDTGDEDSCRQGASRLAGAGTGSTPTGDDYLMGVIYALWATRPEAEARELSGALVETAVPLTTTLSGAWLRAAGRGEATQPWHDLVNGVTAADDLAVEHAIRRIISCGHSSGAEALSGFTAALADQA
jgi:hypothetical protein